MGFFNTGRKTGGTFDAGIENALAFMLVSPQFLFRFERDPEQVAADGVYRLSDLELASRLSFFIWSSIPDDQLLNLAVAGKLHTPAVLDQQVKRMLADERARALGANFAGQWLYLRNLRSLQPDEDVFPDFDDNLRQALQRETEMLFESVVIEDRQRSGPARRRLHVPERAARAALRHPEHLRRSVPPRARERRRPARAARAGQRAHAHLVREPHVAGARAASTC